MCDKRADHTREAVCDVSGDSWTSCGFRLDATNHSTRDSCIYALMQIPRELPFICKPLVGSERRNFWEQVTTGRCDHGFGSLSSEDEWVTGRLLKGLFIQIAHHHAGWHVKMNLFFFERAPQMDEVKKTKSGWWGWVHLMLCSFVGSKLVKLPTFVLFLALKKNQNIPNVRERRRF